jgi:hypothetical protein
MNQSNRPRMVDGHIVRDDSLQSTFSFRRFLLVLVVTCALIITNPANQLYDQAMELVDKLAGNQRTQQRELSDWAWQKIMDPPVGVTNYGLFTVEERHAKVVVSALTKSWSCPYFDSRKGSFCSALAKNLSHGNPLLYHPKSSAYTVHRTICFLLVTAALLAFCCHGTIPTSLTSEPFLRAILTCFSRNHFSFLSLAMDLVSAER